MRAFEIGLGHAQCFSSFVRIGLRHGIGRPQAGEPRVIEPRLGEHRLRAGEVGAHPLRSLPRRPQRGLGNGDLLPGFRIIEPGEKLPGFHRVPLIHQHLRQPLLNARADRRLHPRLQRARAHDLGNDFATSHGVRDRRYRCELEFVNCESGQRGEDEPGEEAADGRSFHGCKICSDSWMNIQLANSRHSCATTKVGTKPSDGA